MHHHRAMDGPVPDPHSRARRRARAGTLLIVAAVLVGACNPTSQASPNVPAASGGSTAAPSAATETLPVAGSSLTVCVPTIGAQDWTPWLSGNEEEIVTREVGDVLIGIDEQGELVPGIATSWELSEDLSTWTFTIRDDVPFHGGYGFVTAEDVKFSVEQYLHPDSNQSITSQLQAALQDDIDNFEVVSPTEFKIHMDPANPVVYLATVLSKAVPGLPINSKKYYDELGEEAFKRPLGTGPYEMVSSEPGTGVVLKAVPNHWRQTAYYETINLDIVEDEASRVSLLKTGDCDLAPLSPVQLKEAAADGVKEYVVRDVGTGSMVFGGWYYHLPDKLDCDAPWIQCDAPDKGRAIREAMSLAIDRATILDKIFFGYGTLLHAGGFEWPSRPSTVDPSWTLPEFNVEKAKAKLAEGGYPDGFPISQWIYLDLPGTIEAGQAVAGMWEDIGLQVTQEVVDYRLVVREAMRETKDTAGHSFMRFGSNYPETVQAIAVAHGVDASSQAYTHPLVDEYNERLKAESDQKKREALALELMTKMREETVMIPLYTLDATWGASEKVGTWSPVAGYGGNRPTNMEGIRP